MPKIFRSVVFNVFLALLVAFTIRTWVFTAYKIRTTSMLPSLWVGDFVLAYKLKFTLTNQKQKEVQRGDLLVINGSSTQNTNYIKRVVGLAGDRILIRNNRVILNDVPLEYTDSDKELDFQGMQYYKTLTENLGLKTYDILVKREGKVEEYGPIIVPPGHIFVLGDNRDTSEDSRLWGSVPASDIIAMVWGVWLSMDWTEESNLSFLPKIRWQRIGEKIP